MDPVQLKTQQMLMKRFLEGEPSGECREPFLSTEQSWCLVPSWSGGSGDVPGLSLTGPNLELVSCNWSICCPRRKNPPTGALAQSVPLNDPHLSIQAYLDAEFVQGSSWNLLYLNLLLLFWESIILCVLNFSLGVHAHVDTLEGTWEEGMVLILCLFKHFVEERCNQALTNGRGPSQKLVVYYKDRHCCFQMTDKIVS